MSDSGATDAASRPAKIRKLADGNIRRYFTSPIAPSPAHPSASSSVPAASSPPSSSAAAAAAAQHAPAPAPAPVPAPAPGGPGALAPPATSAVGGGIVDSSVPALASSSPPLTEEEQTTAVLWDAIQRCAAVDEGDALAGGPTLRLADAAELFVLLRENAAGADGCAPASGAPAAAAPASPPRPLSLRELVSVASVGSPFTAIELLHALRMLGDAHATPPPPHDPTRSYRTIFSTRWYPRLWAVTPAELLRIQMPAAYLGLPRAVSDDIIGAVCAQRWANVPRRLAAPALDSASGLGSLYAVARRRFAAAMKPFVSHVVRFVLPASEWDAGGWTGAAHSSLAHGALMYYNLAMECFVRTADEWCLDPAGRSWVGDEWRPSHRVSGSSELVDDDDNDDDNDDDDDDDDEAGVADADRVAALLAKKDARARARTAAGLDTAADISARVVRGRKLREDVPAYRTQLARGVTAAATAAAPVALGATDALALVDAAAPVYSNAAGAAQQRGTHAEYVGVALAYRLRGIALGRRWAAVEDVGAPLAALAGFTRDGEAGSAAALAAVRPYAANLLFAAAGADDLLRRMHGDGTLMRPNGALACSMVEAAAAGGHAATVSWLLQSWLTGSRTLSTIAITLALEHGHTAVADAALTAALAASPPWATPAAAADHAAGVMAAWAGHAMACLGETTPVGGVKRINRHRASWKAAGIDSSDDLGLPDAADVDAAVVAWAVGRGLPLGAAAARRLAASPASLASLKALPAAALAAAATDAQLMVAATFGGAATVKWLLRRNPPPVVDETVVAAIIGGLEATLEDESIRFRPCLATLRALLDAAGAPMVSEDLQADLCAAVASLRSNYECGVTQLEVLQRMRSLGVVWDHRVLLARNDDVFTWAVDAGCPMGNAAAQADLCAAAAAASGEPYACAGQRARALTRLQALRARGATWDVRVLQGSVDAAIVEWALDAGAPVGTVADQHALVTDALAAPGVSGSVVVKLLSAGCAAPGPASLATSVTAIVGALASRNTRDDPQTHAHALAKLATTFALLGGVGAAAAMAATPLHAARRLIVTEDRCDQEQASRARVALVATLAAAGWPWSPRAARAFAADLAAGEPSIRAFGAVPPARVTLAARLATAHAQGARFDAVAIANAARQPARGADMLRIMINAAAAGMPPYLLRAADGRAPDGCGDAFAGGLYGPTRPNGPPWRRPSGIDATGWSDDMRQKVARARWRATCAMSRRRLRPSRACSSAAVALRRVPSSDDCDDELDGDLSASECEEDDDDDDDGEGRLDDATFAAFFGEDSLRRRTMLRQAVAAAAAAPPAPRAVAAACAPLPWDERCISPWNLASWQVAADYGCPWTTDAACAEFEARAAAIVSDAPGGALTAAQRGALAAAELHRHWLLNRWGRCPCRGKRHLLKGAAAAAAAAGGARTDTQLDSIIARGRQVVEPFLALWGGGVRWRYVAAARDPWSTVPPPPMPEELLSPVDEAGPPAGAPVWRGLPPIAAAREAADGADLWCTVAA